MTHMAQRVLKIIGIILALACLLVVRLAAQTEKTEISSDTKQNHQL